MVELSLFQSYFSSYIAHLIKVNLKPISRNAMNAQVQLGQAPGGYISEAHKIQLTVFRIPAANCDNFVCHFGDPPALQSAAGERSQQVTF